MQWTAAFTRGSNISTFNLLSFTLSFFSQEDFDYTLKGFHSIIDNKDIEGERFEFQNVDYLKRKAKSNE